MSKPNVKNARTAVGHVVSNKMDKTIVVTIERLVKHPKYGKYIRRISRRFAHDETNQSQEGDVVLIKECRPLSRNKSWTLVQVLENASGRQ
ncbi:MAG: 30S ribosomal protein S17 [uncultured bacterium]|nr:MAG: 30S ribosomal protein S17 [uncultured bacterium]OGT16849.1 MAG: 30S ribosomal protein S17 [Gammaproteobacteria bacterium RIFCSPHIGHO2_02_FULL_38_33]OGT23905.1 MAG: 30S ribosomal protein S17 [Gammaproteobacteria bacterium RIFCSPHIGHO2_12_38_15]OGT67127.1 MAG: 30S ribosomal protein S17 [Gammaproteobacteria bacterium RIFCSPLOWO2_02_FULL_38_11]OGT76122.1 MAG: 30S ribosomal protein S17 [Gammaproteobacteria bacterium RIFCSPLOWO2_12_FULL_38_14]